MSHRAAARLHEGAEHREASAVERDRRDEFFERRAIEFHAVGACEPHVVGTTDHVVALTVVVPGVDDAALAHHGVEVQFLLESFPQPQREVVEADVLRTVVGGADDGRVAPDIAETDRAFFEHGDIGDAEVVGEVVGGGETVTTTADDDDLILLARFRLAPRRAPAAVSRQRFAQQPKRRIASARAVPLRSGAWDIAGCRGFHGTPSSLRRTRRCSNQPVLTDVPATEGSRHCDSSVTAVVSGWALMYGPRCSRGTGARRDRRHRQNTANSAAIAASVAK